MARVIVTSSADADLYAIQVDLAKAAGIDIAAKYTALFENLYDRLAKHPASGAPRLGLGKNIRIGSYCLTSSSIGITRLTTS
jgi:plasmid stabilization system protein ParE